MIPSTRLLSIPVIVLTTIVAPLCPATVQAQGIAAPGLAHRTGAVVTTKSTSKPFSASDNSSARL